MITRYVLLYLEVLALFTALFPGVVKMLIRVDSPFVNIGACFLYVTFALVTTKKPRIRIFHFTYAIAYLFLMINLSILLNTIQLDAESIKLVSKGLIYLVISIVAYYTFNLTKARLFLIITLFISFILVMVNILFPIDHEVTRSNYLILSFVPGIAIFILFHEVCFEKLSITRSCIYMLSMTALIFTILTSGGRGTLLFGGAILVVIIYRKLRLQTLFRNFWLLLTLCILGFIGYLYFLKFLTVDSWMATKLVRLFSSDIKGEPRYELYSNAYIYFIDNFNLFGLGFHSARYVSTSWDESLPYLESFPLEMIFNFGVLGALFLFYIGIFILFGFRLSSVKYPIASQFFLIFLYVFLNFSKGWSVYAGLVAISIMAMVLSVYRHEKRESNINNNSSLQR